MKKKILKQSTQFKKDLKRYLHIPSKLRALKTVTTYLEKRGRLPKEFFPHTLSGNYKGYWECHIEDDYLLIWIDESTDIIRLVRLGTHHELFGK